MSVEVRSEGDGSMHDSVRPDADATRPRTELSVGRPQWRASLARRIFVTDGLVLALALATAMVVKFGFETSAAVAGGVTLSYQLLGIIIALVWLVALQAFGTRDSRVIVDGALEYRRIIRTTVIVFGSVAIVSLLFKIDISRGYLAVAFPLGLVGLVVGRKGWRVWLRHRRVEGRYVINVLVVGGIRSAQGITGWLDMHSGAGMKVTGVWVPDRDGLSDEWLEVSGSFVPVMGTARSLAAALEVADAEMVIVTDSEHLGHDGLKNLMWELEGAGVDLMISPNVVDVARSRLQLATVASMPFLHVEEPKYAEASTWPKVFFDRVVAFGLVVAFGPVLLATALAVKLSSPGPVFYRQERIGRDGRPFRMTKFRSMRVDADEQLYALLEGQGKNPAPLAKVQDDPRVTRVGKFIRRYSLDELPQLFNVLAGDMSLVGPRPQRQFEVEAYDETAHRRLRVRPGMTGLWQVSGRSDLDWEDAIRLDTYYVENWSMTGDLLILWKTIRAVLGSSGAY